MRLTVVGTGYVGLVTGTCFANTGYDVTCLDTDATKIETLNRGGCPIFEQGLDDLIAINQRAGRLHFTTDAEAAYARAELIFICVGTPCDEHGQPDLRALFAAARDIGDAIERTEEDPAGPDGRIVVVKSTVPVSTGTRVREEIASRTRKPFRMASNPEFLKEGTAVQDFLRPDRVVIGCEEESTAETLRDLYGPFVRQGNPIYTMDVRSAEMVKYAANAMLATKISFINEIAGLCEAYGADVESVRAGMCADVRIGRKFFYPGLGYGGSCFPKDVQACIEMGRDSGFPTRVLEAVHQVNEMQRDRFMDKIASHFPDGVAGRRFAIWGVAFKPGTDDIREAPAVSLIQKLIDRGAEVVAWDLVALAAAQGIFGDRIRYADHAMGALDDADALVICTDWDEFKQVDFPEAARRMNHRAIFDGRNLHRPETVRRRGFWYYAVGRPPARPVASADAA